jgi:hypothetical protein
MLPLQLKKTLLVLIQLRQHRSLVLVEYRLVLDECRHGHFQRRLSIL